MGASDAARKPHVFPLLLSLNEIKQKKSKGNI
jgi:hypothetical protein